VTNDVDHSSTSERVYTNLKLSFIQFIIFTKNLEMKYWLSVISISFVCQFGSAQTSPKQEKKEVQGTIDLLFDGMREGDSSKVSQAFHADARLMTIFVDKAGNPRLVEEEIQGFLNAVGTPHTEVWNEKLTSVKIQIDGNLAQAWTKYMFYVDENFSHCGVNAFQLAKDSNGWKIIQITDTRRKTDC
jgi:hypothetical protein